MYGAQCTILSNREGKVLMNNMKRWNVGLVFAVVASLFAAETLAALEAINPQQLLRSDNAGNENFGFSVDIDGDRAVVGAWLDDGKGSAYVFVYNGAVWVEEEQLFEPGGLAGNRFGWTVGIEGDVVVVGAPTDSGGGQAWVFTRVEGIWDAGARLVPGEAQNQYGMSVAMDNATIVVGERWDAGSTGAAHVFEPTSGIFWGHTAKLLPVATGQEFGMSVAIDGETIVVGAPTGAGTVYAFDRPAAGWADATAGAGETLPSSEVLTGDFYGGAVAVSGDLLVVGAPDDDASAGSITIFDRSGGGWVAAPKIVAPDGGRFGNSVAVSGPTVVAGAPQTDSDSFFNVGSFYLFAPDGIGGWTRDDDVKASTVDRLGQSIALDGDTLLVGASTANFSVGEGVIYDVTGVVVPPSDDGDGIAAAIDGTFTDGSFTDESGVFSSNFTDQNLGGATYGTVTNRADLILTIDDAAGAGAGVDVMASGIDTGIAQVTACSSPMATFAVTNGDAFDITCGSVMTTVTTGPVELTIPPGIEISVPSGGTVEVSEDSNTGTITVANTGSTSITVNGETVESGESLEFGPAGDDDDSDGVLNGDDLCPDTNPGAVVDGDGCAISDYCPCEPDWRNHGAYVRCVSHKAKTFARNDLISKREKGRITSRAARSTCGK